MNPILILGAAVVLAILGVVTYFGSSARSSETRAREERDLREKAQQYVAELEQKLAATRQQLITSQQLQLGAEGQVASLRADVKRLEAELVKLAPGDQRLKSTLSGGV